MKNEVWAPRERANQPNLYERIKSFNNKCSSILLLALLFVLGIPLSGHTQTNQWLGGIQSDQYRFSATTGTNLDLRLNNSGNAGFYTNRPYFVFYKDVRLSSGEIGSDNNASLRLHTNGIERMRINREDGFTGINLTDPKHHLQIHGTTNYSVSLEPEDPSDPVVLSTLDYGRTGRFAITNSTTGADEKDGGLIMQNENDLRILNQAPGNFYLSGGGVKLSFVNDRAYLGVNPSGHATLAKLNVYRPGENGLRVRTSTTGDYGILSIAPEEESALLVAAETYPENEDYNFKVTGGGTVYGRKFVTTLDPFPDYVFESDYELMGYDNLRSFIASKKHLPNMPTAEEIEENGADLGEINRVLVEKVEEMTLYILELEERLAKMEAQKSTTHTEDDALEERISKLETMIEEMRK